VVYFRTHLYQIQIGDSENNYFTFFQGTSIYSLLI